MNPLLAVALIMLAANDPLTMRIEDSAAAAQTLQGPFDGAWTLRDHAGAVMFTFQMSDPPGSVGPVQGAWRDAANTIGAVEFIAEGQRRLRVRLDGVTPPSFVLIERRGGTWRGALSGHGVVTLTRGLATPRSPV